MQFGIFPCQPVVIRKTGILQEPLQFGEAAFCGKQVGESVVHVGKRTVVTCVFAVRAEGVVLTQNADAFPFGNEDGARTRFIFAGNHAEERGLSATVDTDDAQFVGFFQREGHLIQDDRCAEMQAQIVDADCYHGTDSVYRMIPNRSLSCNTRRTDSSIRSMEMTPSRSASSTAGTCRS
ncbi:unknown [Clostridium sp. CAG:448]|nr:unknown [Clostridium sp. CAG:448]